MQYLSLEHRLSALQKLENHWDDKLSRDVTPYPLAPKDLVKLGLVTDVNYVSENSLFGRFCSSIMRNELSTLHRDAAMLSEEPLIEIFGAGLARDLGWISDAIHAGLSIRIREISSVSREYVTRLFREHVHSKRITFVEGEIEDTLREQSLDLGRTVIYYASQFVQVLHGAGKVRRVMRTLSHALQARRSGWSEPRLYLVHPLRSDNSKPRVWKTVDLPGVKWGDTTPYDLEEIKTMLTENGTPGIKVNVMEKHNYFHQIYSFLKISADC